jgi:hypothetical protein
MNALCGWLAHGCEKARTGRACVDDEGCQMSMQSDQPVVPAVEWVMSFDPATSTLKCRKLVNGQIKEAYSPVSGGKAAMYALAVIQGFEPPRSLVHQETPAG